MVTRGISDVGLLSIGRQVRGAELDGDVVLTVIEAGIMISPLNIATAEGGAHITRFDQYNRISLPAEMRRAANIKKRVDVVLDGKSLIISPSVEACVICGSDKNLKSISIDKFICESCRKKML